jgi:hypothetical protein
LKNHDINILVYLERVNKHFHRKKCSCEVYKIMTNFWLIFKNTQKRRTNLVHSIFFEQNQFA